jgi:DNA-binding transcriptional ArsR family regulator
MAAKKPKSARKLERHFKGVANRRRIEILLHVSMHPGVTLEQLAEFFDGNIKTYSEHTRRLVNAGLVEKSYAGRNVEHGLTPYGEVFVDFITKFANTAEE